MLLKYNPHSFYLYWNTFQDLKNSGFPIPPDAFRVLISGYAQMCIAKKAMEVFSTMKDFNCKADIFTYNYVLHVMVQKQEFLLGLAV